MVFNFNFNFNFNFGSLFGKRHIGKMIVECDKKGRYKARVEAIVMLLDSLKRKGLLDAFHTRMDESLPVHEIAQYPVLCIHVKGYDKSFSWHVHSDDWTPIKDKYIMYNYICDLDYYETAEKNELLKSGEEFK